MDEEGIIRVGGRLKHSNIPYPQKHQALLPAKHPLTKLIILNEHFKNSVKAAIKTCVTCFKAKPTNAEYIMSNLPERTLTPAKPIENISVDYFGPIHTCDSMKREANLIKSYGAIFVCFATKAEHVELVRCLSTEAFLAALRRLISRRENISNIYSDNGSQFVGATAELKRLQLQLQNQIKFENVKAYLANNDIKWHFILLKSPHFGGLWEAALKSVKLHLTRHFRDRVQVYKPRYYKLATPYPVQQENLVMLRFMKSISFSKSDKGIRFLSLYDNYLVLDSIKASTPVQFHYFWLRDHCRCPKCFNFTTHQISNDVSTIPFDIRPKFCEEDGNKLRITWPDGHKTEYELSLLRDLTSTRAKPQRDIVLWNAEKLDSFKDTSITCKEYYEAEDGKRRLLRSLLKYGFGFITNVEPTLEATEKVVRHTTLVKKTVFGEMWEVVNGLDVQDTAYSTIALDAHNDNTYFSEATGVMVFHMLERDGTGGKTLLVDGFNAANNLKNEDKNAFDILTTNAIESQYIGNNMHFTSVEPVIKLHPATKDLWQIRYNHYDRAYLNTLPFNSIMDFYRAYVQFGKEIKKKSNEFWIQLEPGTILFIDNWRVMHGRSEYTGKRRLSGCYVARRDWTSAAKREGLSLY
ncbi:hypothetical protein Trydic_g18085 [Trypoxylus dichotomus]